MIKNIILTSVNANSNKNAILCLEKEDGKTLVSLKGVSFEKDGEKKILGIKTQNEFYKVEINEQSKYVINKEIDLNEKISAVIIKIENNKSNILLWGSNETTRVWQNSIMLNFEDEAENTEKLSNNVESQKFNIDKDDIDEDDEYESDEEIEEIIDKNIDEEIDLPNGDDVLEEDKFDNKSEFLASIEEQINELLNSYEEEKALEELIPNSKFVKVNSKSKDENFYIFGVIYDNNEIKYIVYGIPGEYSVKPDDEYENFYQWLPLSNDEPEGYGYYLMYQDASNGNQIEIIYD